MMLAEIKPRQRFESPAESEVIESTPSGCDLDVADFDFLSWEVYSCWKQQHANRFGAGTSAPSIPRSQRQYDGDNHFDFCEIWID